MVKLRLKRFGKKREASYRIVAIDSRARRQGRPIEELGYYNPRTKETTLKVAEIAKWLRQGAQPSDTLDSLLKKARIYDMVASGVEISSEPIVIASSDKVAEKPAAAATAEETAAPAEDSPSGDDVSAAAEESTAESPAAEDVSAEANSTPEEEAPADSESTAEQVAAAP